jgi:hypothetical protein
MPCIDEINHVARWISPQKITGLNPAFLGLTVARRSINAGTMHNARWPPEAVRQAGSQPPIHTANKPARLSASTSTQKSFRSWLVIWNHMIRAFHLTAANKSPLLPIYLLSIAGPAPPITMSSYPPTNHTGPTKTSKDTYSIRLRPPPPFFPPKRKMPRQPSTAPRPLTPCNSRSRRSLWELETSGPQPASPMMVDSAILQHRMLFYVLLDGAAEDALPCNSHHVPEAS